MSANTIFTIGHSTRSLDAFIMLLNRWEITGLVDVRSSPWSRYNPQFNKPNIKLSLAQEKISYRFYGRQLGGRPSSAELYRNGIANYEAMAETSEFRDGLDMVINGSQKHRLALMCSEHDPIECHRCLLVGRILSENGNPVQHILSTNEVQSQGEIESRILKITKNNQHDFLKGYSDPISDAYRDWSERVAYSVRETDQNSSKDTSQYVRY